MKEFIVFNHHSLPFATVAEADNSISDFLKICVEFHECLGIKTILMDEFVGGDWYSLELAYDYFWRNWFNSRKKEKLFNELNIFLSISTRHPLFDHEDIGENLSLFDVREKSTEKTYEALRAAVWHKTFLLSFPTRSPWIQNTLEIRIETISENEGFCERDDTLLNFSLWPHWEEKKPSLLAERNESIDTGSELWDSCKDIFPHLEFCGKTQKQLQKWSHGGILLSQVKKVLTCLNSYVENMKKGIWNYSHQKLREHGLNYEVSGESSSVYQDEKLRKPRTFSLPSGEEKYFENHIKLPSGYRLHFFVDDENRQVFIGYIGSHLPTKKT